MRPGASADSLIARPMRVDLSSPSLISPHVQHAARSSRVVMRLRIGEQIELEAGDGHLADRDRLASVGGDA